jgi:hypothetical protein
MFRGRSNTIVGQTGEYLVAAELSRRGQICTTFTSNVPHYDIIASNEAGKHVSVQVKASKSGSWQFSKVTDYCEITFKDQCQTVGKFKDCPVENLVVDFVNVMNDRNDRYYVLNWNDLRYVLVKNHKDYLKKHDGVRPKNHDSLHVGLKEEHLSPYIEKWEVIESKLA